MTKFGLAFFALLVTLITVSPADEFEMLDANRDGIITREEFARPRTPAKTLAFDTREAAREHAAAQRAANRKLFAEAFEQGKALTVRTRLERAAAVTAELVSKAEGVTEPKTAEQMATGGYASRSPVYPRESHIVRLICARPWLRESIKPHVANWQLLADTVDLRWPTEEDQVELRNLVEDHDPEIRAMAMEALAALHDPADLKFLARQYTGHFSAETPTPGIFVEQLPVWANGWPNQWAAREEDPLCLDLFWRQPTLGEHVDRALQEITGDRVSRATFKDWVAKHGNTRHSLWYWQQRLQQQFDRKQLAFLGLFETDAATQEKLLSESLDKLRKSIRAELATLDPQTEAKVLLLAKNAKYGTHDLALLENRFFDPPWQTRLTKDKLFALLEGGHPWSDVDWVDANGNAGELRTRVVTRIMLNAEQAFAREDVPRLRKLLDTPNPQFWWPGRAAALIGISRLLPAATQDALDDPQTRDGYLRRALGAEPEVLVRGYVARELVRIGLPANKPVLLQKFFDENDSNTFEDVRFSILEALGEKPLSAEKRSLLLELWKDSRSRTLFTRPRTSISSDWHRRPAVKSLNAHAGRELVTIEDLNDLLQDNKSEATFDRILKLIGEMEARAESPSF